MFHLGPTLRFLLFCISCFMLQHSFMLSCVLYISILYVVYAFSFVLDLSLQKANLQFKKLQME